MATRRSWRTMVSLPILMLAASLALVGCRKSSPGVLANRPECAHDFTEAYDTTRYPGEPVRLTFATPGEVSIAGQYTNVPEFHDCQRLIRFAGYTDNGVTRKDVLYYQELAAVFLAEFVIENGPPQVIGPLSTIVIPGTGASRFVAAPPAPAGAASGATLSSPTPADTAIAYVEVVSEGVYEYLGIGVGFNCLLLARQDGKWGPVMVQLGLNEPSGGCASIDLATTNLVQTPLLMKPHGTAATPDEVPNVTRWDWDSTRRRQLIGLPCWNGSAAQWCDVGPATGFDGANPHGAAGDPSRKRIKGWYDEQLLADGTGGWLAVSGDTGTVYPAAVDLGRRTEADYRSFRNAAFVAVSHQLAKYFDRYGFAPIPATAAFDDMAAVALCYGEAATCGVRLDTPQLKNCKPAESVNTGSGRSVLPTAFPWWARITMGSTVKYFCVAYRGYPDMTIPSVTRWRWRPKDETIWIPCPQGCCEVDVDMS